MEKPRVKDLVASTGISKTYASDILSGKQAPSRPLAIHIFRRIGWRDPTIASFTDEQIAVFEQVDPWVPVSERAA